ncbi:MAG: GNAT family N-acetyltransferase [Bacteroidota bacterium]
MKNISIQDITIRTEIKSGDIGYVTHLHGKLYKSEFDYGIQFETYVAEGLNEFYRMYDPANNRVWVCEHDRTMIGFLLLMNRGEAAQLRYFIIEPEYRSIGLGKKLMDLYMAFLRQCGYSSSYLLTTHELHAAAHLYKKHGFKLIEEKPASSFFGKPLMEHRYELDLKN